MADSRPTIILRRPGPPPAAPTATGDDGGKAASAVGVQPPVESPPPVAPKPAPEPAAKVTEEEVADDDQMVHLRTKVHETLIPALELPTGTSMGKLNEQMVRQHAEVIMKQILDQEGVPLSAKRRAVLLEEVMDEVVGYGPIQSLLDDPTISEVMVNAPDEIFVERKGKVVRAIKRFNDDEHTRRIIDKILAPLGRRVNERTPIADGRLPDGSRVNVIIPPLALKGSSITIRKFSKSPLTDQDLVDKGSMTAQMRDFLKACVEARLNIIIAGGTGSGKTTLLNVMSSFIPKDERLVTVEDAAELQIHQPNLVALESRPPNIEGEGQVTIRDLVRNALRMRPERIVVGECRGGEALDMLQAMNTGHDGSMSTVHSNTPRDTISRLETLAMMSGLELPIKVLSKQIASAINIIVQQARLSDGSRRVTYVTEVQGMEGETILLQDIFVHEQKGIDSEGKVIGEMKPTGFRPKCVPQLIAAGCKLPPGLFT